MKRPVAMSIDHMESIAHREGRTIEVQGDLAFMRMGRITYVAQLDAWSDSLPADEFAS